MRCIQEAYAKYRLSLVRLRRAHKLLRRRGGAETVLSPDSVKLKKDFATLAGRFDNGKNKVDSASAVTISLHAIESDPHAIGMQNVVFEVRLSFYLLSYLKSFLLIQYYASMLFF